MKTSTAIRMVISLSLLALLASCAPTSSNNSSESYQNAATEQSNIIGGDLADLTYQKSHGIVGIMSVTPTLDGGLRVATCTGSLIAKNLVLTAAHCVNSFDAKAMFVVFTPNVNQSFGISDDGRIMLSKTTARQVSQAIRNPKYNSNSSSMTVSTNDIALLRLAADAPADIQLASLPPADLVLKKDDVVSQAGYGVSQFKSNPKTGEPLLSKGSGVLRKVDGIKVKSVLPSGEEVTFDQSQGRGACHGDSGGPAYLKVAATDSAPEATYVVGVTSRGPGDCNEIAVYSSTIGQAKWIADTTAVLLNPAPVAPNVVAASSVKP